MIKSSFIHLALAALLVTVILLAVGVSTAQAGPGPAGHWHGSPDPDACNSNNDCIYIFWICYNGASQTLGSHVPDQIQHELLVQLIGAEMGKCAPSFNVNIMRETGRCKLVDIDAKVSIGAENLFEATWLGRIGSLRFRNSEGAIVFLYPIPGTVHLDDCKTSGLFSVSDSSSGTALLTPGKYQVACFGEEGSLGQEIRVTVSY